VPVDASGVDEIDAAGVQLLVALAHSLARAAPLRCSNPAAGAPPPATLGLPAGCWRDGLPREPTT
jgi:hypothetical protein